MSPGAVFCKFVFFALCHSVRGAYIFLWSPYHWRLTVNSTDTVFPSTSHDLLMYFRHCTVCMFRNACLARCFFPTVWAPSVAHTLTFCLPPVAPFNNFVVCVHDCTYILFHLFAACILIIPFFPVAAYTLSPQLSSEFLIFCCVVRRCFLLSAEFCI